MKNVASLSSSNGESVLVGTHKLSGTPDRIELFFIKAKAVPTNKP
jgi:hypothetical protein